MRMHATRLQSDLRAAVGKSGWAVESQAHLAESLSALSEALRATMSRG
jgi:hypothetical protein